MDFLYLGCPGLSLLWLLSLWSTGSRTHSSCSSRGLELRLSSCGCMGLVAPEHVKSSWTRDQIHVPCFGRQILNHWATREVHMFFLAMSREHGLDAWGRVFGRYCCTVHITALQARVLLRKPALVHWDPSPKSTGDLLFGKRGILVGDPFIQLTFRERPLCQTPCWMLGPVQTKQICFLILWI